MEDRPEWTTVLVVVIALAALAAGFAIASHVLWTGSSDVTFNATDGPEITLGEDTELKSHDPFPTNDTVWLGELNLTSSGQTSATVYNVNGPETTLEQISTNNRILYADHIDTRRIGVEGIDTITWQPIDLEADQTEISVSGAGTLYIEGFNSNQNLRVMRDGSPELHKADSSGVLQLSVNGDDLNIRNASAPTLTNPTPTNEEPLDSTNVTLQVDIFDDDFGGDTVTLDWFLNNNSLKTTQVSSDSTVSVETDQYQAGLNEWRVEATDSQGNTDSISGSFRTPTELELRNETSPDELVTEESNVTVTFFADGSDETITKTTSDGKLNMTGLPLNEDFTVQVEAENYTTRESYVSSVVERQRIYLLPKNADSATVRFDVSDPTGQFSSETTRVFVKKPITRNNETTYETVVADIIGTGTWTTTLERSQRYKIEVRDIDSGATRELGPYVATADELVELEIDQLDFSFSDQFGDGIGYHVNAEYVNQTGPGVEFTFDAEKRIDRLDVVIYQRNDEDTVILNETIYNHDGPISLRGVVPESVDNPDTKSWVVAWDVKIDGETYDGTEVAGSGQLPQDVPGVGQTILSAVGMLVIFVVAGLFSQANVGIGAITTAIVAGALWFIGVVPGAVSGIGIAVALLIGILYHVRDPTATPR